MDRIIEDTPRSMFKGLPKLFSRLLAVATPSLWPDIGPP